MQSPRRILLLFEYPTLNGGERSILAVLRASIRRHNLEFVAACPPSGSLHDELHALGVERHPLDLNSSDPLESTGAYFARQLRQLVDAVNPDLIHANSLAMGRRLGRVCHSLSVPGTAHLRDIIRLSPAAVNDLNQLAGLVAVSEATRQFHIEQGIDEGKVATIHNGVDLNQFSPRPATGFLRQELQLPDRARLALNVGQICLRKGHDVLARTAISLRDRIPDLHWIVCGERYSSKSESIEFERRFHETFRDAGMADRLHLLGYRDDIAAIMNEVDLLVHAARQEPLGRVLLEAAASALPIVATDVGGTREVIENGVSGLLVASDSAEEMSSAIERLLTDHPCAAAIAANARNTAAARFDVNASAGNLTTWWRQRIIPRV